MEDTVPAQLVGLKQCNGRVSKASLPVISAQWFSVYKLQCSAHWFSVYMLQCIVHWFSVQVQLQCMLVQCVQNPVQRGGIVALHHVCPYGTVYYNTVCSAL